MKRPGTSLHLGQGSIQSCQPKGTFDMARKQTYSYPIFKIVATTLACGFFTVETWLNADTAAQAAGWLSPAVALIIMASIGAFASLPLAERAAAARQYVKAAGLGILFGLMAIYSLTASLDRVAGGKDTAVATVQGDNNRTSLAKEGYETAKAAKETECASGRDKKCRDAEAALEAARKVYMAAPPKREEDSGTKRITAALPFLSAGAVQLYQPLILPVAFQLGAFLMLALGLSPRGKEPAPATQPEQQAKKKRRPRKRRLTAVAKAEGAQVFELKTRRKVA